MDDSQVTQDHRGWEKGRLRRYSVVEKRRVVQIRETLEEQGEVHVGEKFIRPIYKEKYGTGISGWFVNRCLREYDKLKKVPGREKQETKNANLVGRLLKKMGKLVMNANFYVSHYSVDRQDSFYLLSCSYSTPYQYGIISQIQGLSTDEVIRILRHTWKDYEVPDILTMGNHAAFGTNTGNTRRIGELTFFLLNLGVIPLYLPPRMRFANLGPEKFNMAFSEKFLRCLDFKRGNGEGVEIDHFHLEYRKKQDDIPDKIKNRNPFFLNAFTDQDLKNRDCKGFRAKEIFFCV